ncbi:DUF1707 SHOCT-like domain-containing protein [Actinomycetospora straminea]|uniref:DUF1707 SHOCT-like domain-containing protein n=1 Tax=Actinomycetospora straminea TaxID=663607 RepID=UPI00236717F9|nr:DUF1707 domain-containing protein [Actinomycetospora straminea]MDD7931276.1 DUF1707 domain-containing protein [Actinomycetospora straminea]
MTEAVAGPGSGIGTGVGTGGLRVADADRERVASVLERAHAEGRLTLAEYDERVRAAHGAVVAADLAPLTADLPAAPAATPAATPATAPARRPRVTALRVAVAVWAAVSVINLVIWVAVSVGTGGAVAPWWIWVAGPWGAVLALQALGARAGLAPPAPFGCAGSRALRR